MSEQCSSPRLCVRAHSQGCSGGELLATLALDLNLIPPAPETDVLPLSLPSRCARKMIHYLLWHYKSFYQHSNKIQLPGFAFTLGNLFDCILKYPFLAIGCYFCMLC